MECHWKYIKTITKQVKNTVIDFFSMFCFYVYAPTTNTGVFPARIAVVVGSRFTRRRRQRRYRSYVTSSRTTPDRQLN